MTVKTALIDQFGSYLGVKQGRFILKVGKEVVREIAPVELDSIVVTCEGVSMSSAALMLAARFGIDVVFLRHTSPVARILPYRYGTLMKTWALQLKLHETGSLSLAKKFIEGKIYNQRLLLLEYSRRLRSSGRSANTIESKAAELAGRLSELVNVSDFAGILQVEGHAARSYWEAVSTLLPDELGFHHRYTRSNPPDGPLDPFNKALNIGYALLKKEVWRAVFLAGLNPYLGFLHKPRGGRPALVLDLMEEFRPVSIDRPLIGLARTDKKVFMKIESDANSCVREIWGYLLKYLRESKPSHIDLIASQARKLVLHLQGVSIYTPYKSRW
ncbi:MAG: CRISPR-associated endonuclease Cas1 [Nitrososphaerota archaeon]